MSGPLKPVDSAPAAASERPLGVSIIAVLAAVSGLLGLFGSVTLIGASGAAAVGLGVVTGILLLTISILLLVFAYGAWTLQPWAWTLGIALEVVGVLVGLYQLVQSGDLQAILNVALAVIVLYYLFRPNVKAAFQKA